MTTPSESPNQGAATTGTDDPSARVQRIPTPIASPGSCAICGKNEHPEGFADARLDFEFYGTFYLCGDCVGDYARLFGYVSSEDLSVMRAEHDAMNSELNTLRQAILGLESTVDNLIADAHRRNRASLVHDHNVGRDADSVPSNPVDESDAGLPVTGTTEPSSQVAGPTNGPAEPGNVSRPNDVLDTSAADRLLGL